MSEIYHLVVLLKLRVPCYENSVMPKSQRPSPLTSPKQFPAIKISLNVCFFLKIEKEKTVEILFRFLRVEFFRSWSGEIFSPEICILLKIKTKIKTRTGHIRNL